MTPTSAKRRAPKQGYLFPEKAEYRRQFWTTVAARLDVARSHVLILPSAEGAEIPILLDLGFSESQIHAVDGNPALIATAEWRKAYPKVHAYGSMLPRALERIRARGVLLSAANFDLCGCFSTSIVETMQAASRAQALADTAFVGLTMLKGREERAAIAALRLLNKHLGHSAFACDLRLDAAMREFASCAPVTMTLSVCGEYTSQTQRMVWGCFELQRKLHGLGCVERRGRRWRGIYYLNGKRHTMNIEARDKMEAERICASQVFELRSQAQP